MYFYVYLKQMLYRKDMEINNLNGRVEEEQNLVAQLLRKIKELNVCIS